MIKKDFNNLPDEFVKLEKIISNLEIIIEEYKKEYTDLFKLLKTMSICIESEVKLIKVVGIASILAIFIFLIVYL